MENIEDAVAEIVENVRRQTKMRQCLNIRKDLTVPISMPKHLKVTEEEIREAYEQVDPSLLDVIRKALVNIRDYHEKQKQYSWFDSKPDGTMLGQKVTATCTESVSMCRAAKQFIRLLC